MGHPEDHEAWAWIVRARGVVDGNERTTVPQSRWNLAYEELLVAEGSDWMWWFGNDFTSDDDAVFDSLFRRHIGNIYRLLGSAGARWFSQIPSRKVSAAGLGRCFRGRDAGHRPSWPGGVAAPVRRKCEASEAAQTGWWFRFKNISV